MPRPFRTSIEVPGVFAVPPYISEFTRTQTFFLLGFACSIRLHMGRYVLPYKLTINGGFADQLEVFRRAKD